MKKIFAVTLLLLMLFNITAFAASETYELEELEIEITIPDGYHVITRDTPSTDPVFDAISISYSDIIAQFERDSIYLNAFPLDGSEEVVVTMTENTISDLSDFSDDMLDEIIPTFETEYSSIGITITDHEYYRHSEAKFIKIYFTDSTNSVYGLQYYTVYDNKAMNFTMRSYSGSISYTQESTIRTIVDSIDFSYSAPAYTLETPAEEEVTAEAESNSFIYLDPETLVSFTVPENWKKEPISEDSEYLDAQFISTDDSSFNQIIYGSTDLWESIPDSDKVGYSREDINHSFFTTADIADMVGVSEDEVSTVRFNGIEYYKCNAAPTYGDVDLSSLIDLIQFVYIEDGWMYMFQFGGDANSEYYDDFESLISSVKYSSSSEPTTASGGITYDDDADDDGSSIGTILIIVFVLLIIGVIVLYFVLRKKPKKTANVPYNPDANQSYNPNANQPYNPTASQPYNPTVNQPYNPPMNQQAVTNDTVPPAPVAAPVANNNETVTFCSNCGEKLYNNPRFCQKCGAETAFAQNQNNSTTNQ